MNSSESDLFRFTSGPRDAKILIVGEAWGSDEAIAQSPFVGASGKELDRMLLEAGVQRSVCLATNLIPARPQGNEMWRFCVPRSEGEGHLWRGLHPSSDLRASLTRLYALINLVKPELIIACGNYPLWALTDVCTTKYSAALGGRVIPSGIGDFRGSMLFTDPAIPCRRSRVLPIYHPALILRDWSQRAVTVHDLKERVTLALRDEWESPKTNIIHNPSYEEAYAFLETALSLLSTQKLTYTCDIETRNRLITCVGFGTSPSSAIVIPFWAKAGGTFTSKWTPPQEARLIRLLCKLLTHPNIQLIGQNFLYDMYYFHRTWNIQVRCFYDTMLAQHLLFPGTSKGLGYLSSLYCRYHRYWKDDNHEWDAKTDMDDHLRYNGEDCIRTFEVYEQQAPSITQQNLTFQWEEQLKINAVAFELMCRGVRVDRAARAKLLMESIDAAAAREAFLLKLIPQEWIAPQSKVTWPSSPSQQKIVFFDLLKLPPKYHKKTKQLTLDKEALPAIKQKHREFAPIISTLLELRSIELFISNFIRAPLSPAGRLHCSFNPGGTKTFRWSSSKNPLGEGANLQTLPKGGEK